VSYRTQKATFEQNIWNKTFQTKFQTKRFEQNVSNKTFWTKRFEQNVLNKTFWTKPSNKMFRTKRFQQNILNKTFRTKLFEQNVSSKTFRKKLFEQKRVRLREPILSELPLHLPLCADFFIKLSFPWGSGIKNSSFFLSVSTQLFWNATRSQFFCTFQLFLEMKEDKKWTTVDFRI
jgi:hypothetical protein